MKNNSYKFEDKEILRKEISRLGKMNQQNKLFELPILIELGLRDSMLIFDLGCGIANIDFEIARHFTNSAIIGLDRDLYFLDTAFQKKRQEDFTNINFVLGDAEEIPIANESVDFCFSRIVFQHLSNPQKVINEIYRIIKPNGIVAIVDIDDGGLILHQSQKAFINF